MLAKYPAIHTLVCNAGVWVPMDKHAKTEDGFEVMSYHIGMDIYVCFNIRNFSSLHTYCTFWGGHFFKKCLNASSSHCVIVLKRAGTLSRTGGVWTFLNAYDNPL